MIQASVRGVRIGVIAASTPNSPLRLAGILVASVAFFAIVGGALVAAAWMIDNQRGGTGRVSEVAGAQVVPDVSIPGVIALQHVSDAAQFEDLAGFSPFIPDHLPATTTDKPALSLTFPDADGNRIGRVGFSAKDVPAEEGITGPIIVLVEARGKPGASIDSELKRLTAGNARAVAATLPCGDLVVDAQFYFGPNPAEGEPFVTPYMTSVATDFLAAMTSQC